MAGRKSSTFTEVELEFMQIFWEHGEMSSEDIQNILSTQGRELTDGTIRKVLGILLKKGHLLRERRGRSFYYLPSEVKEKANGRMIQDLLNRAFSGSIPNMVATLLDSRDLQPDDIETIKMMISDHEKGELT